MIITRTPYRITLGGGGTDLPSYYEHFGGFLVSGAINRYMYIIIKERFEPTIRVSYSRTETVSDVDKIIHPIVREALKYVGLDSSLEIISIGDIPSGSGLGSSGSFTVGLLNALHNHKGQQLEQSLLAEQAFHIESEILGEPVGKQDQYIASFGNIIAMDIDNTGKVSIDSEFMSNSCIEDLEKNLVFFYTGIQRQASEILDVQSKSARKKDKEVLNNMHKIKKIGQECYSHFKEGDVNWFGNSLHTHWIMKKGISKKMSTGLIDEYYNIAMSHGALGGKIMGAGGGGFMMFYKPGDKKELVSALESKGLKRFNFLISRTGTERIYKL